MEENKKKKNIKKSIIIGLLVGLIIGGIGTVSYAMFTYSRSGLETNQLITGDIWMRYVDTNNVIDLQNAMPSSSYTGGDYFEFDITGRNTYNSPIYYEIVINHGTVPNNKTEANRIADEFLRFRLVTVTNDTESSDLLTVSPAVNQYYNIDNERIYVGQIAGGGANASETTTKYRLYCWIDNSVGIGSDYTQSEWNDLFASIRVDVNGDLTAKTIPTRTLITYNVDGGSKFPSKKQIATDATTYGTLAEPTKDGYDFDGWYSDQELTTKVESTTTYTNGTSATTLYAKWNEPLPTIDSCPGCVFTFSVSNISYNSVISSNYYDINYKNYTTQNGRFAFLGLVLNETTKAVEKIYSCACLGNYGCTGGAFCIEGTSDSSRRNELFTYNSNLLDTIYDNCDTRVVQYSGTYYECSGQQSSVSTTGTSSVVWAQGPTGRTNCRSDSSGGSCACETWDGWNNKWISTSC